MRWRVECLPRTRGFTGGGCRGVAIGGVCDGLSISRVAPMPEDVNGELPQSEDDDWNDPDEWRDYAEEKII